jgi:hypothetical protein
MIKLTAKHYKPVFQTNRREWPKYSTQILNIASQNCKATSTRNIGSIKELWLEMRQSGIRGTLKNWTNFYNSKKGETILDDAGKKLYQMILKMGVINIDEEMCIDYVKETVYNKTHMGLAGEEMAVEVVADYFKLDYRFSNAEEEKEGIDAWIGDVPVQVKKHDGVFKSHVRTHADYDKTLVVTYEEKKKICYIHNPEKMPR